MRHPKTRLTHLYIQSTFKPGRYADGHGLYLQVSNSGGKSWIFRYRGGGKAHNMGLGSIHYLSLANARGRALALQQVIRDGGDPLAEKRSKHLQKRIEDIKSVTFDECAKQFIANKNWKNLKHRAQWVSTLDAHASPVFGTLPVQAVDAALVIKALSPIWKQIPETASRVRGRIEAVLAYANASGFRTGENPARWKGHLDAVFEKRSEIAPVKHMPALPWRQLPAFMTELRAKTSHTARAIELMILTGLRPGESIGARVGEMDMDQKTWIVPAARMKKKVEHRIPLSPRVMEIINVLLSSGDDYLFPGLTDKQKPMSTNSMLKLVKEMRPDIDITSHGFRSCFRDWASESTNFSNEVCEAALAHKVENKVEAAYRRGDLFLKRTLLMADWADYCASIPKEGVVVDFRASKEA